jgi:hypothetical protein
MNSLAADSLPTSVSPKIRTFALDLAALFMAALYPIISGSCMRTFGY